GPRGLSPLPNSFRHFPNGSSLPLPRAKEFEEEREKYFVGRLLPAFEDIKQISQRRQQQDRTETQCNHQQAQGEFGRGGISDRYIVRNKIGILRQTPATQNDDDVSNRTHQRHPEA